MWNKIKKWFIETFWVSEELRKIVDGLKCATENGQIQWTKDFVIGANYFFEFEDLNIQVGVLGFDDYHLIISPSSNPIYREFDYYESGYIKHLYKAIKAQQAALQRLVDEQPDSEANKVKSFKEWAINLCEH
jgi:hypothetical protein